MTKEKTMNGLHTPDLGLALSQPEKPSKLTPRHWLAPILFAMGEATFYQPRRFCDIGIDRHTGHRLLLDEAIKASGFDPQDPESLPAPLRSVTNPIGIYRSIQYAMRQHSVEYLSRRPRLGAKGVPLFIQKSCDQWALTEHGTAVAASIRHHFVRGQWFNRNRTETYTQVEVDAMSEEKRSKLVWVMESTVTGKWLQGFLTPANYSRLVEKVTLDPRAKKERESGEILDHIGAYFESVIRCDTFRNALTKGDPPTFRQLHKYVLRRCISAYRSYGQDCLMRHQRSALSDIERKNGNVVGNQALEADTYGLALQECRDDVVGESTFQTVIVDDRMARHMELDMAWNEGMEKLKGEVFKLHKKGNPERYENIFNRICDGISQKELASEEGVKQTRAANLMQECRLAVKRQAKASEAARILINYLNEDPWSTVDDMVQELNACHIVQQKRGTKIMIGDTDLNWLLEQLVGRGRIQFHRGSYAVTDMGLSFVSAYTDAEVDGDFFPRLAL